MMEGVDKEVVVTTLIPYNGRGHARKFSGRVAPARTRHLVNTGQAWQRSADQIGLMCQRHNDCSFLCHDFITEYITFTVTNLRFLWNAGSFLTHWRTVSFPQRTLLHDVSFFFGEGLRSRCYGRTAVLRLIMQPCDKDDSFFYVFPSNGAPVEWNWQGKT